MLALRSSWLLGATWGTLVTQCLVFPGQSTWKAVEVVLHHATLWCKRHRRSSRSSWGTQKWQGQRWSTAKEKRSKLATVRGFALPCSLCPCFLLKGRAELPHQGSKARSQAKPALWTKHSSFVHSANHRARAWGWVMHSTWVLLSCYHCSCHGFCLGQQVCSYKNVQKWCRGSMGPQGPFPVGSLDMPSSFAQKGERVYVLFFLCPLAVEAKQKSWSFLFTFYIVCFYRKNPIKCCFPSL